MLDSSSVVGATLDAMVTHRASFLSFGDFNKLCEEKLVLKIKDINKGLRDIDDEVIEKIKQWKELNEETRLDLQKKISEIKEKLKELEENNVYLEWFDIEKEIYACVNEYTEWKEECFKTIAISSSVNFRFFRKSFIRHWKCW